MSQDIQRLNVGKRLSEATIFNGIVHLAGLVPEKGDLDIRTQTQDVLAQVDRLLAQAGSDKTRLLRVQIYLANMADMAGMNEVWDTWVPQGSTPPRATVEARLANPDWKIEIVVTAAVKG